MVVEELWIKFPKYIFHSWLGVTNWYMNTVLMCLSWFFYKLHDQSGATLAKSSDAFSAFVSFQLYRAGYRTISICIMCINVMCNKWKQNDTLGHFWVGVIIFFWKNSGFKCHMFGGPFWHVPMCLDVRNHLYQHLEFLQKLAAVVAQWEFGKFSGNCKFSIEYLLVSVCVYNTCKKPSIMRLELPISAQDD